MRIGIDISQMVYEGTGVARYIREMVEELVTADKKNTYVLFGASFRKRSVFWDFFVKLKKRNTTISLITIPIPPVVLDVLWNKVHWVPVEWLIGPVDIFWSSDWTQPPLSHAKGITTIHDLAIFSYPESFSSNIVSVHRRKLKQSMKECAFFLCDSECTRQDTHRQLGISLAKMAVVYPGYRKEIL